MSEPPLILAISVFLAIRDAIASCGPPGVQPDLTAPATQEAVLRTLASVRAETVTDAVAGVRVEVDV